MHRTTTTKAAGKLSTAFFGRKILGDAEPTHFAEQSFRAPNPSDMLTLWRRNLPEHAISADEYVEERIREAGVETLVMRPRNAPMLRKARQEFRERLRYATMAFEPEPGGNRRDAGGGSAERQEGSESAAADMARAFPP